MGWTYSLFEEIYVELWWLSLFEEAIWETKHRQLEIKEEFEK
jgi:hypothetical protein